MSSDQYLSDYFDAVAYKRMYKVEINPNRSNQHEFNGTKELKRIFGDDSSKKLHLAIRFIYLCDEEDDCFEQIGHLTWYDARQRHPTRSEFRLYYEHSDIFSVAQEDDSLFIIRMKDGHFITIVCKCGSTAEYQVKWLLGIDNEEEKFSVKEILGKEGLGYAAKKVLETLGVELSPKKDPDVEEMLSRFDDFPKVEEFSRYARSFVNIDPVNNPDGALIAWVDKEESFFKALEMKKIIAAVCELSSALTDGTSHDVIIDKFISMSLSIQNRRKSRAGASFEYHLRELFDVNKVLYTFHPMTENKNVPDFIMPSIEKYHESECGSPILTMLAAKTTCKDRWRQILEEADKIPHKHLVTLEPSLSPNSFNQMVQRNVQLIAPESIHETYSDSFRDDVWNMEHFIDHVLEKQSRYGCFPSMI